VRWAGEGEELWFVRVETFVEGDSARLVEPAWQALEALLVHGSASEERHGADQGTGLAEPVVGMVFSVAATTAGAAANTAVAVAVAALGDEARGLYGVSVFTRRTAPAERDPSYPSLDD